MKVLYWNVYIGNDPATVMNKVRDMCKEYEPDLVGLGEASKLEGRSENVTGYKAFWLEETYMGRGDTIVLVKNDVNLRHWNWVKFTKWWTGPKHGLAQGPKRFWNGRVRMPNLGLTRISVGHWPFNTALPEVESWCVMWFNKVTANVFRRPSVHLGDLNMGREETGKFVKRFNGEHVGAGVDRAMFKHCRVTAKNLGHRGSDHPAVLFTILPREKKRKK